MMEFSGLQYLKIDIASSFGLDKLDWDQRVAWTDQNIDRLEARVSEAGEPAMFWAGVQALRKAERGEEITYPISLDAASSGLQLLACLTGCEDSAKLCGVVSTGHREDAYTVIYQAMCDAIGDTAKIERSQTKQAIMTSLYSSKAIPKQVFGEGELLATFYKTMQTMAPGAWALNEALQSLWQPYALSHDWVMPDNFHAHVPVMETVTKYVHFLNAPVAVEMIVNQGTKEGRSISPNIVHAIDGMIVREIHRRCTFDRERIAKLIDLLLRPFPFSGEPRKEDRQDDLMVKRLWALYESSGFLSARILDHLDEENLHLVDEARIRALITSMPENPFDVISIHDCFRVHPNYGNDLRRQYNQLLSEISASDMLSFIASQVTGKYIPVQKRGDISSKILEADYALS